VGPAEDSNGGPPSPDGQSHSWDAKSYDRISDPMHSWGHAVIDRLELTGSERVLDAGCGSGRVTAELLARLPGGHVVAVDASREMVAEATERFAGEPRVEVLQADLLAPLPVEPEVDAILSTATFHWIRDHDRLFANLASVLRRGGRLSAQCGGAGNLASIVGLFPDEGGESSVLFAAPEDTVPRLERAGFVDVEAWLQAEPTSFPDQAQLREYLRTIVLRTYIEGMPAPEADALVARIADAVPGEVLDYVRLNIVARRG
jgi:trans-aconitate 2-methyltransferase